ncbi:hypothetical protein CGCF245_v004390 [Colletotrichum fructicola]|nr:hypothetical protein CGCF245_v004390 [Colletotrichum fructicola]
METSSLDTEPSAGRRPRRRRATSISVAPEDDLAPASPFNDGREDAGAALSAQARSVEDRESSQPRKRSRTFGPPDSEHREESGAAAEETQTPEDRMLASIDLDRYLQPPKRRAGPNLSSERQEVLESAISLARKAMREPGLHTSLDQRVNNYDPSMYPSAEFLHMLLKEWSHNDSVKYFMETFGCLSPATVETYALDLIDCIVHDQRRAQFIICVNYAAYAFISCLESPTTVRMQKQLARSKQRFRDNVVAALQYLDTTPRPDIPLLNALLSAAMLMQDTGNMRHCWKLNTLACKVAVLLKDCAVIDLDIDDDDSLSELQISYIKCFIFDTSLSANMYQPACLASLDINEGLLTKRNAGHAMLKTLLSISFVSRSIILETRKCAGPNRAAGRIDTSCVGRLRDKMRLIRDQIKFSSRPDEFLIFEWQTMECIYYSLMTTINRLSSTANDDASNKECLEVSRRCLLTLKGLLDTISRVKQPDRFLSSLAWVAPLFPLRPIYFVFRNVIESLDALDLKILQDLAKGLDGPAKSHHSILEVQRLCTSLVNLYTEFSEKAVYASDYHRSRQNSVDNTMLATGGDESRFSARHGLENNYQHCTGHSNRVEPPRDGVDQYGGQGVFATPEFFDVSFLQQSDWELFYAQPEVSFAKDLFDHEAAGMRTGGS